MDDEVLMEGWRYFWYWSDQNPCFSNELWTTKLLRLQSWSITKNTSCLANAQPFPISPVWVLANGFTNEKLVFCATSCWKSKWEDVIRQCSCTKWGVLRLCEKRVFHIDNVLKPGAHLAAAWTLNPLTFFFKLDEPVWSNTLRSFIDL